MLEKEFDPIHISLRLPAQPATKVTVFNLYLCVHRKLMLGGI